ncbi:ribonuclease H-like domain-containing protein [Tanacetum coccineum]
MDDEPMWVADRVVALTPGSAITIPITANEFAIKGNHLTIIKGNQFDGRIKTDPHKHINEFLRICDMFKYRDTENEAVRLMMFLISLTGEAKTWLDELNEGTIKTWDELQTAYISRFCPPTLFDRLLKEIQAFSQHENESLTDAWLRMKEMLRNYHGHNLSKVKVCTIEIYTILTDENHAPRRNALVDTSTTNALVVQDGIGGYDWSFQAEEGITNFALMAYTSQGSSSSSSSDSEVHTCSKDCLKSYETLQKQYDQQREALNKSNLEIIGYQMGLESLEARIVVHEKNEAVYEEDIAFLKYDVQVKDISIKDLKNQLEEALKEKDDLKLKLNFFEESSKNLTKLINSQISAKDKAGLGYDSQINKSEVVHSVFNSRESDVDNSPVNDRFKIGEGFHAVPPPYTGNYMPSRPDLSFAGLDDSVYKTKVSETITTASKTSKDNLEKPKTVRPSAPIIEDWDTDSDNDSVFRPKTDQTKPKFTKINFVKSDENVKSVNKENTHKQVEYPRKSQSPRGNRRY